MAIRPLGLAFGGRFPRPKPEPEIEEDEEEETPSLDDWTLADEYCTSCNERLHFVEEVVCLTVEQAFHNGKEVVRMPFIYEEGPYEGDFYYDPLFFEFSCWEDLKESLEQMVEDAPPVKNKGEILTCSICDCSICEWEIFGTAHIGEIHVSRRMPNGESTSRWDCSSEPYIICLGCLVLVNDQEVDLWDQELNQIGECQECTHIRCWRHANCSCPCHEEGSEEPSNE